jgi:serine/threonine-protein kinase
MPLEPATRLGIYEVLGPLGAGGMGEVYRARDTRLGRDVAIKVLPESVAKDETRLARFEREARLLASLNHPGIAAVYGFEEAGGIPYIVMELVPGETLTQRLAAGALTLADSLSLARQIAEALEAAHEKGVVHRDLKPANIKITPEGKVKVLDLGLAKAFDVKSASDEDMSRSPTLVLEETRPGVILGTVEFMSPEQARGKAVDKRTDIWAFGCILYEMLSGRRAFTGETISDVMVAILDREPNWGALPRETPPRIRDLLTRCLEKDASRRLRDVGDARIEVDLALAEKRDGLTKPIAASARHRRWTVLAVVAIVAAGVALLLSRSRSSAPSAAVPAQKYLAVLPFRDLSGRPGGQLVGDGFVETVSARLAEVPGMQVVTPATMTSESNNETDPYRVARNLGANLILRGAFQRSKDDIRITYSVWNAQGRTQLTAGTVTGPASDIFGVQDALAEKVARSLELAPGAPRPAKPTGLATAGEQDRYLQAIGNLQRYDKPGSVDEAIRLLQDLSSEKPSATLVHAALGRAYLYKFYDTRERRWIDLAAQSGGRARQLDPDLPEVHVTFGELRLRTGEPKEATQAFQTALALQPNNFQALLGLARAYAASGDTGSAEATYQRAIRVQPNSWSGYSELAAFYSGRGQYAAAAEMFRRVTVLTPDNPAAFSNLGAIYGLMGDFERALSTYRKSLALTPTDIAYSNLGTAQFYLAQYEDAARSFEAAVGLTQGNYQLWANLGDAYRWTKTQAPKAGEAYARAIALAGEEIRLNPQSGVAHSYLALCLAKTGEPRRAEEHARKALALEPANPEFRYNAAVVATIDGRSREALERIRRALEAGYSRELVAREPEFANLRALPEFQALARPRATTS